jgi:two-component system sensor histidine kinase GlrK
MRLTIFSRLVIGFIIIFLLQMAVSLYVSISLHPLEKVPDTIKDTDYKIIMHNKKLTDILMSQMRYEKKFIITRDTNLYEHFLENKREFNQYLNELQSIVRSIQAQDLLIEIEQAYSQYQTAFDEEVTYIKAGGNYSQKDYKEKKEETLSMIIEKLKKLTASTEQSTYEQIEKLGEAVADTRKVAIMISLFSFLLGIVISIFVTRGIVKPLSAVKQKTQKIASGDFSGDLNLLSPPEVKDLANTINWMCYNLKHIDKIKADFFASMSHELRTPLTSIKEGINLLREKAGKETGNKQQRLLAIMAEESNRLIELINSFLDLSKMEAGMMRYTFFPEDITPLIYKAINGIEPLAEAKNITIEAQVNNGLPIVKMDSERILQVLRNLLGNAVKFTNSGGQVMISARPLNHGVEVSVMDTGEGIAEEDLIHIFDKFQQGSNVNDSNNIGTGLGLSIVKHIIDAHGGTVWAKSKIEIGSTFVFVLSS